MGDLIRKGKEELDDQRSLIDSFTEGSGTYGEAGPEYDKALEEFNEMAERYRQRELRLLTFIIYKAI